MKKKFAILIGILCLLYVLDSAISHVFFAIFSDPRVWSDYIKSLRQMFNAIPLYVAYISYFRLTNPEALPNINIRQFSIHGIAGFSTAFAIIFLCLILTPEFYSPKSGIRELTFDQIFMPFTVWVGGAIIEEVLYRGIIQRFLEWFLPTYIATLIQISMFVYVHDASILGHSSPVSRILSLAIFGLLATFMAKKSPYLILPIFFHFGENFFTGLIRGQYGMGWDIPGMWIYQTYIRLEYRPFIYLAICAGYWYWWQKRGKSMAPANTIESGKSCTMQNN